MPIKGLTAQTTIDLTRALPRLATLRKGAPKPENGKQPGKDLDYFRVEFPPEYEHLRPVWESLYGKKPQVLSGVYLAAETADAAFPTWMEEWTATKLLHRCDGETQVRHFDGDTYSDKPIACAAPKCNCRRIGRLYMLLPEFSEATGMLGVVQLITSSIHDIISIYNYLSFAQRTLGTLRGVKFEIGRVMREVTVPANGKRINVEKSLIYINIAPDFMQAVMLPRLASYADETPAPALPATTGSSGPTAVTSGGNVARVRSRRSRPVTSGDHRAASAGQQALGQSPLGDHRAEVAQLSAPEQPGQDPAPDPGKQDAPEENMQRGHVPPSRRETLIERVMDEFGLNRKSAIYGLRERLKDGTLRADMSDDEVLAALRARAEADAKNAGGDVVDGEFTEAGPQEQSEQIPLGWPDELMTPGMFKARREAVDPMQLYSIVRAFRDTSNLSGKVTKRQTTMLALLISQAMPGRGTDMQKTARHALTGFFFSKDGISTLSKAEASAMIEWLTGADGELHPCAEVEVAETVAFAEEVASAEDEEAADE